MTKRRMPPPELLAVEPAPRHAVRYANYSGSVEHVIGEILGPTELGDNDYMVAVEVDGTRVGFAVARPSDFAEAGIYKTVRTSFGLTTRRVTA